MHTLKEGLPCLFALLSLQHTGSWLVVCVGGWGEAGTGVRHGGWGLGLSLKSGSIAGRSY